MCVVWVFAFGHALSVGVGRCVCVCVCVCASLVAVDGCARWFTAVGVCHVWLLMRVRAWMARQCVCVCLKVIALEFSDGCLRL